MIALLDVLAAVSGSLVGFSLGLIGGGGSIMAVPLLLYVVGVKDPHIAIGTSALAVAVNAFANLAGHWRAGTVKWPCATVFAISGVLGAAIGSTLGKAVGGEHLVLLFAVIMIVVGVAMLRPRGAQGDPNVRINPRIAARIVGIGFVTGLISGFFGIGGGFLIVPGIMLGSGMAMISAIGSSLFSVGAFGLTAAVNYAFSGLVDWQIAADFIAGGFIGGFIGMRLASVVPRRTLTHVFSGIIFAAAGYILLRGVPSLFA